MVHAETVRRTLRVLLSAAEPGDGTAAVRRPEAAPDAADRTSPARGGPASFSFFIRGEARQAHPPPHRSGSRRARPGGTAAVSFP